MTCHLVIPGTFIACGEGGNYCSEECRLEAARKARAKERGPFYWNWKLLEEWAAGDTPTPPTSEDD